MLTSITAALDPNDKIGSWWCSLMHASPMWPVHGEYECRQCGRRHKVAWADVMPSRAANASRAEFNPRSLASQTSA